MKSSQHALSLLPVRISHVLLLSVHVIAVVFFSQNTLAQPSRTLGVITGTATDTTNTAIVGASIYILDITKKIITGGVADNKGRFHIKNVPLQQDLFLRIQAIGYDSIVKSIRLTRDSLHVGTIKMSVAIALANQVLVEAVQERGTQKGDTTEFNVNAFKTDKNASADELVRKMPGIEIENGQVRAQGETVKRILVDGKPFFGDDPQTTLKNLPSEIIDKVQVYNQGSDQSQFTGVDDGERNKTLNIVTREDRRRGQFGKLYAGYGGLTDIQDRYTLGGNINIFNGNQRISVIGMSNNINQQNFSISDILGAMGGGGQMMRMAGAMGGSQAQSWMARRSSQQSSDGDGGGMNISNFLVNQQNGITTSSGVGINYSDQYGKSVSMTGSYFFNKSDNETLQDNLRQNFLSDSQIQIANQNSTNTSSNINHRLTLRTEIQLDSSSSLLITPNATWQSNDQGNTSSTRTTFENLLLNSSAVNNTSNSNGYSVGGNILYRLRFETQGRTLSINTSSNIRNNDARQNNTSQNRFTSLQSEVEQNILQEIPSSGKTTVLGTNINYTEPLAKNHLLQISYNINSTRSNNDRRVLSFDSTTSSFSFLDTRLSSLASSVYTRHRPGVNYRFTIDPPDDTTSKEQTGMFGMFMGGGHGGSMSGGGGRGFGGMGTVGAWVFNIGADYQYALLDVSQTFPSEFAQSRTFTNFLPSLSLSLRPTMFSNVRFSYRTSTNQPSINQLQPVIDNTNPLSLSTGNPQLNQEFSHQFSMNYGSFNMATASGFFTMLNVTLTNDKIVNSVAIAADSALQPLPGVVLRRGAQFTRPVNTNGYLTGNTFLTYSFPASPLSGLRLNISTSVWANYTRDISFINEQENIAHTTLVSPSIGINSNISENIDFGINARTSYNTVTNTIQQQSNQTSYTHSVSARLTLINRDSSDFLGGWLFTGDFGYTLTQGLSSGFNQGIPLLNIGIGKRFFDNRLELKLQTFDALNQNGSFSRTSGVNYIEDNTSNVLTRYYMLSMSYNLRIF